MGKLEEVKYVPTDNGTLKAVDDRATKSDTFFVYFTAMTGGSAMMGGSSAFTWTSSAIPMFLSNDTSVNPLASPASVVEISVLAGFPALCGLLGGLLAPYVSDLLGRKRTLQLLGLVMLLCQIILAFSSRMIYVIMSRSIFFIAFLGVTSVFSIYLTELSENHNRAKFGSFVVISLMMGSLMSYIVGPISGYKAFTLIISLPLVYFLIFFMFACESPIWLLTKGRREEAAKALRRLRSNKNAKEIELDMDEIEDSLRLRSNSKQTNVISLFKDRNGRIGVMLAVIPFSCHYISGIATIMSFLGPIFNAAGGSISTHAASIIVGSVKLLCMSISAAVIERAGRRFLLIASSIGCGLANFLMGLYLYLKHVDSFIIGYIQWLPLASIILFAVSFSVGLGPLPTSVMGEMFTPGTRSAAISFVIPFVGLFTVAINFFFPLVSEYAGMHYSMWIFSGNCFLGALWVYLLLPETGGRSIQEIQDIITHYKFKLFRKCA
uniref:Major facilitator superfamily protein n=1 Tax=Phyllotreta armoraciae TaxID=1553667 RepID=A0A858Z6W4_9CUCU|nr:major facilitator superfamily protein [Phyllotreta armoraciae]